MIEFKNFEKCPNCGAGFDSDNIEIQKCYTVVDVNFKCHECNFEAEKSIIPSDFRILEEGET